MFCGIIRYIKISYFMFRIKSIRSQLVLFFVAVFLPYAAQAQVMFMDKPVVQIVLDLVKFLLSITGGIALFVFIVSGIMYMMSMGNPDSKNSAKKTLTSALVGLFLVLISYAIMAVLDKIFVQP